MGSNPAPARSGVPQHEFVPRPERLRDGNGRKTDAERTKVEPGVAAIAVEHPSPRPGAERHTEAREHGDGAKQGAHDARTEKVAHENRIEWHDTAIGEP